MAFPRREGVKRGGDGGGDSFEKPKKAGKGVWGKSFPADRVQFPGVTGSGQMK